MCSCSEDRLSATQRVGFIDGMIQCMYVSITQRLANDCFTTGLRKFIFLAPQREEA